MMQKIAFCVIYDFHHAMLRGIYNYVKDKAECIYTSDVEKIVAFNPNVLIVADTSTFIKDKFPNALIVWTRHGFSSKNLYQYIACCDIACVSSEWIKDYFINKNIQPSVGYWVTGFPALDGQLEKKVESTPKDFKTLIYAPTHNPNLNSISVLGFDWIAEAREKFPNLRIIIKPHPVIADRYPDHMQKWKEIAAKDKQVELIENTHSNIYSLFNDVDILLTDCSSVMFYFLAWNKPIILVNNPNRFQDEAFDKKGPEWRWRKMGIEVKKPTKLMKAIRSCLLKPNKLRKKRLYYKSLIFDDSLHSTAAEIIGEKVINLLKNDWLLKNNLQKLRQNNGFFHA